MARTIVIFTGLAMLLGGGTLSWAQTAVPSAKGRESAASKESKLCDLLKSGASEKEKADACLELARIGTKESVEPLAALLGDEKLSHMARYALEPIPDPAVDDALRAALGKLKGRLLVGVIGSVGVRRDAKALELLEKLLGDSDADVAQAAARALGSLGSPVAAKALEDVLAKTSAANQPAVYEGLFRCAEAICGHGQTAQALVIYDRLAGPQVPKAVRDGAARRARLLRLEEGRKI
jgi:HEAT repeat protein